MIKLPQITLIAVSSKNVEGHRKALDYSCLGIEFGAVVMVQKHFDSIDDWSKFIVYDLTDYVHTEYCILVHADGFIVSPEMWQDDWLKYDFAGSPFPLPTDDFSYRGIIGELYRVGNSVSLRSKKLLDLPRKLNMEWKPYHGFYNEDGYISVNMRHVFEQYCKFMPFEEAVHFGRENPLPENEGVRPFLFHKHAGENKIYPKY